MAPETVPWGPQTSLNIFYYLRFTLMVLVHNFSTKEISLNALKIKIFNDFNCRAMKSPHNSALGTLWGPPKCIFVSSCMFVWFLSTILTKELSLNALKIKIFDDFSCRAMISPHNSPLGTP